MRIGFSGLSLIAAAALTLGACSSGARLITATPPVLQSNHVADLSSLNAVKNIGGTYQGQGDDSVFARSVYVLTFSQTKSSLVGLLTWGSKVGMLQTKVKGSVTATGYSVTAGGVCTGNLHGRISLPDLSGLYKLKCSGVVHTGSFGVKKVTKP
jgi:hypothetical protein